MEKINIIMGIYNCDKYLSESIESILKQTCNDWRLIMCDDGSKDDTYEIALKYQKQYPDKILLIKNDKNMGLNYTLNNCLKYVSSKFIARQDGDDISEPTRLEKELSFLEGHKEYAFITTNMNYFDETGVWGKTKLKEVPEKEDFIKGNPFCHATCMIRKEVMDEVDGYTVDDKLLRVEDYHLWFKIYAKGYKGYNISECLYNMRDDKNAIKRRTWKNRFNEVYVKKIGYKMLNIKKKYYIYAYKSILIGLLPKRLYLILHKKKGEGNAK